MILLRGISLYRDLCRILLTSLSDRAKVVAQVPPTSPVTSSAEEMEFEDEALRGFGSRFGIEDPASNADAERRRMKF